MLEAIIQHNIDNPDLEHNSNYKENFIKSGSGLRLESEEESLP